MKINRILELLKLIIGSYKQLLVLVLLLFATLPNDIKSQSISNSDIIGEWEEELDELSSIFVNPKRFLFMENNKVEIYQNDQLLSSGKYNLYNGNIVFSDLSVLIFQTEGSFAFPILLISKEKIEWKGLFGILTRLNKIHKFECIEYISPIFIEEYYINEINIASRNSGFPNSKYPYSGVNGCGPENFIWHLVPNSFFGLADFTVACDCHDKCYSTSDDRDTCDDNLYYALVDACKNSKYANTNNCLIIADNYRFKVVNDGLEYFKSAKIQQASYEKWLKLILQVQGVYKFTDSQTKVDGECSVKLIDGYLLFNWKLKNKSWSSKGVLFSDGTINIISIGYVGGNGRFIFNSKENSIEGYLNHSQHLPSESIDKLIKLK